MFENIRADLRRKTTAYGVRPEDQTFFRKRITPFLEFGTFAVVAYRFGSWAYKIKVPVIRQILWRKRSAIAALSIRGSAL